VARFDSLTEWDCRWIEPSHAEKQIRYRQAELIDALEHSNRNSLAALIHPGGLRICLSSYLSPQDHVFARELIAQASPQDTTRYCLGSFDNVEDRTWETVDAMLSRYEGPGYDNADGVSFNERISGGNCGNNAFESYPGSIVVEYMWKGDGDPNFRWHSTHFIFLPVKGEWFLAAITLGYWCI
jgi:hypothetical protein